MGGTGTALTTIGAGEGGVADGAASELNAGARACWRGAGVALPQPTANNAETSHVSGRMRMVSNFSRPGLRANGYLAVYGKRAFPLTPRQAGPPCVSL
jgi:hypothetical protein